MDSNKTLMTFNNIQWHYLRTQIYKACDKQKGAMSVYKHTLYLAKCLSKILGHVNPIFIYNDLLYVDFSSFAFQKVQRPYIFSCVWGHPFWEPDADHQEYSGCHMTTSNQSAKMRSFLIKKRCGHKALINRKHIFYALFMNYSTFCVFQKHFLVCGSVDIQEKNIYAYASVHKLLYSLTCEEVFK